MTLPPELLSFTASSYRVEEGEGFINIGVQRMVNPGTNMFFFSIVITDGSARGKVPKGIKTYHYFKILFVLSVN